MLNGAARLFPKEKRNRQSIRKEVLQRITASSSESIRDLNLSAAFKLAFAAFLRLGEITHTKADLKMENFSRIRTTRSDIVFAGDHLIFRLKGSKTDLLNRGVEIVVARTREPTCAYEALQELFKRDRKPPKAPLFSLGTSFHREAVVAALKQRLQAVGEDDATYNGHSFRKGAAQHAADCGLSEDTIKQLGRWTSDAVTSTLQPQ